MFFNKYIYSHFKNQEFFIYVIVKHAIENITHIYISLLISLI